MRFLNANSFIMEILLKIFGEGKDLNTLQMTCRGIVVFLITLLLIRISGRRSFGLRTPLDNIVLILLGSILSRAVAGASPFLPTIVACTAMVLIHRLFGWMIAHNKAAGPIIEGKRMQLFKNGEFIRENMGRALVCEEDVMQGVRKSALTEDLNKIETIYMERNGEISAIKKAD